jgi:hypothetical protein
LNNDDFKYFKVAVETPLFDKKGKIITDKKGNPTPDKAKKDSENISANISFDEYMAKNVLPYNIHAYIDEGKTKIGYEIPFTRLFYKYQQPRNISEIFATVKELEKQEAALMKEVFDNKLLVHNVTTKGLVKTELKDSCVDWIGQIPKSWEIARISGIYQMRNTKVSDKDYPPLSVGYMGVVPQLENAAKTEDGDNRKLVKKNDFVINSRADRRGACGISPYDGSVSLINIVLEPMKNVCNEYFGYLFRSTAFSDEFYKWGNGIVDDLWSTKWSEMKRIYIPIPPIDEQIAIATYLDKVENLITTNNKKITELIEYKKTLIYECVTGKKEVKL